MDGWLVEALPVRNVMKTYWAQYESSIESMMLCNDAKEMDQLEKDEILSYLPIVDNQSVLELGSGIGYITSATILR